MDTENNGTMEFKVDGVMERRSYSIDIFTTAFGRQVRQFPLIEPELKPGEHVIRFADGTIEIITVGNR